MIYYNYTIIILDGNISLSIHAIFSGVCRSSHELLIQSCCAFLNAEQQSEYLTLTLSHYSFFIISVCTSLYQFVPVYTGFYQLKLVCTGLDQFVLV